MAGNGQTIIDLDKKRMDAMATKDIAALNDIISDELVYTHSSARLDTKKSLIGNMESGSTVYTSVVPSDVKAQDLGDNCHRPDRLVQDQRDVGRQTELVRRPLHRRLRQQGRQVADGRLAVHPHAGLTALQCRHCERGEAIPLGRRLLGGDCPVAPWAPSRQ